MKVFNDKIIRYVTAGTLGDSFIVWSKLVGYQNRGDSIFLVRISVHEDVSPLIENFFSESTGIHVISEIVEDVSCVKRLLKQKIDEGYIPVNATFDGIPPSELSDFKDPSYLQIDPFAVANFNPPPSKNMRSISVQVNSGKVGFNEKHFTLKFVMLMAEIARRYDAPLLLLGTTDYRFFSDVKDFGTSIRNNNIVNLIGRLSFEEWMEILRSSSCLVAADGFAAFYTMSSKRPVYMVYEDLGVERRLCAEWLEYSVIENIALSGLGHKIFRYLMRTLGVTRQFEPRNIDRVAKFVRGVLN